MKLITPELEERFKEFETEQIPGNPRFVAKFFNPIGSQFWFASTYDRATRTCYGYITGIDYNKFGYFSIDELENLKLPYGARIEVDDLFDVTSFSLLKSQEAMIRTAVKAKRTVELSEINSERNQHQELER